ncbi:membrane-spanning 4-domains subfamily A member 4A-like isoform X1 [Ictalurus furcatus]|uniref:membrane-spanning 4-domains subfamily A member 4A-like isoform X1 n=1 Tax=Ictalurus furcatus TaxID=66913 RepID=UPI0023503E95|nr:membrane-spanning 4-domains subfamily A member 4A-like isoform X1 [Ictalurus furcatus]XP_053493189.1 membrane-spanning 4-domains subfamily A member 4A-like isoform X1 [Ictalurus furcatus]
MASAPIPLTNVGSGYTIVTQVLPSSTASNTADQNSPQMLGPLRKFLKGEPKALGTVQIMIGLLTILLGIVMAVYPQNISVYSGVIFWGSLLHITAGALAVSASNKLNACVVKGAMVVNIFSTIAAGIAIIMLSLDLVIGPHRFCLFYGCGNDVIAVSRTSGIIGVLLVFSLLQFAISIAISAFTCKATCTNEPTLNIINVVPNPEGCVPVVNSFPAHHAQLGDNTMNAFTMSSAPPAYREKSQPDNRG